MPLHFIVQRFDLVRVPSFEEWNEVVDDQCQDRLPTSTACVRVSGTLAAIIESYRNRDELEVRVITVFGIGKHFTQRHAKDACVYCVDSRHS